MQVLQHLNLQEAVLKKAQVHLKEEVAHTEYMAVECLEIIRINQKF